MVPKLRQFLGGIIIDYKDYSLQKSLQLEVLLEHMHGCTACGIYIAIIIMGTSESIAEMPTVRN